MRVTPAFVREQREWIDARAPDVVALVDETRTRLREHFEVDVAAVDESQYRAEVEAVFADGDRAVNVAALTGLLRDLDVVEDYPGFVVDELLGRELAATIAGDQPLRLLAEATFHYADVATHGAADAPAGADDLDAALAAGFQTRLPGWPWRETDGPFDPDEI